ncbi:MAG: nucleotide pyrophosphohydrolase [bacterium]|nr:nucleotide pyrophosphohydrolase [bacterium]
MTTEHVPLTLSEYQRRAQQTDHLPDTMGKGIDVRLPPLLGLSGEIGTLIAGYKKFLRDGTAYELFGANIKEELGDILWYLANAAVKFGLSLEEIAEFNLKKASDRWPPVSAGVRPKRTPVEHFDADFHRSEQLPRTFEVIIRPVKDPARPEPIIEVMWQGKRVGSKLGDNTYDDSGYRFHDAFHLANAAVLGWSPVARGVIFKCKRKSDPKIDAVEDGGRAIINEEAFVALMFAYARQHNC